MPALSAPPAEPMAPEPQADAGGRVGGIAAMSDDPASGSPAAPPVR
jgi:hypothetical protein